jgi:tRNA(Ile)-lysidine synthase
MVARVCAELGVPHTTLAVAVPPGNLQASARAARYGALSDWTKDRHLDAIATAHHADDQTETLLMRLARGSGVAGLAGIRARGIVPGTSLPLLRPLLGWRRHELADVCAAAGLAPVEDPSNADERFDRARMRKHLAGAAWIDPAAWAASAAHLAEADEALEWAARREWDDRVEREGDGFRYRPSAPRAVRLRVLARIVGTLGGNPRGGEVARLEAAGEGSLAGVLARRTADGWLFEPEPPRR